MNARHLAVSVAYVVVVIFMASVATATTRIQVLRDGIPAKEVEITIVDATSGASIRDEKSDSRGLVLVDDLDPNTSYQVQSTDARHWSADFSGGDNVELEVGCAGWELAATLSFRLGNATQEFSTASLDISRTGIGGGPAIGLTLFAPARKLWVFGIRPFVETDVEIGLLQPDGFSDAGSSTAAIESSLRWRVGGGVAIPITLGSYRIDVEPSVQYALTVSELVQSGIDAESFRQHSVGGDIGLVLPIGSLGQSNWSIDLGVGIQVPLSGSATNSAGVSGESELDIRGSIGLRGTLSGFWRGN